MASGQPIKLKELATVVAIYAVLADYIFRLSDVVGTKIHMFTISREKHGVLEQKTRAISIATLELAPVFVRVCNVYLRD